jgi:hypothetical protein
MLKLHICVSNIKNEPKILKITKSLVDLGIVKKTINKKILLLDIND